MNLNRIDWEKTKFIILRYDVVAAVFNNLEGKIQPIVVYIRKQSKDFLVEYYYNETLEDVGGYFKESLSVSLAMVLVHISTFVIEYEIQNSAEVKFVEVEIKLKDEV